MANTTDFFTFNNRTVYQMGMKADDALIPSTDNTGLDVENNDVFIDLGESGISFTHIYISHSGIASLEIYAATDVSDTSGSPLSTIELTSEMGLYDIAAPSSSQYLRFRAIPITSQTPNILALMPMRLIIRFQDGAFNEIEFTPEQRTRGHHKMLSGGLRPFQGLGIMKRKMSFGCEHVPYAWTDHIVPDTIPAGIDRTYYPGHDPIFEQADIQRINRMFQEHLEFMFADNLDDFPDRIFSCLLYTSPSPRDS